MALRANEEDVQILLEDSAYDCTLFISQANIVVDEFLAPGGVSSLSADRLKLIETYVAAHFAALVRERGSLQEDKIGEAQQRYHNTYSAGFNSTRFGQQAMFFDTTGILRTQAAKSEKPGLSAEFSVVTTVNSDLI